MDAEFLKSSSVFTQCPPEDKPEYAFIGRSNVGKSSLINMIVQRKGLAKTSSTPGKTQLINHFIIDNKWYLVDLPGYGFAKVSQKMRGEWEGMIKNYLTKRQNLLTTFVLVDSRIEPQKNDIEFINWCGMHNIPICIVFTKADKQSAPKTQSNVAAFKKALLNTWEELPIMYTTSIETKQGREELITYITNTSKENRI